MAVNEGGKSGNLSTGEALSSIRRLIAEDGKAETGVLVLTDRVDARADAEGGRTVEQIVTDLLRPMLREWLDDNLPAIIENAVQAEVRRKVEAQPR